MLKDYEIIEEEDKFKLANKINILLNEGYILIGGVSTYGDIHSEYYCQAVAKEVEHE